MVAAKVASKVAVTVDSKVFRVVVLSVAQMAVRKALR